MKTSELLLSSLNITEDEYNYKGEFFLSFKDIAVKFDLADLPNNSRIDELKSTFNLEENHDGIRKALMDMVIEKADISSKVTEGEDYEEKVLRTLLEQTAKAMDLA